MMLAAALTAAQWLASGVSQAQRGDYLSAEPAFAEACGLDPGLPDAFRPTDSLQVWAGNVHSLPDWSRAEPLA